LNQGQLIHGLKNPAANDVPARANVPFGGLSVESKERSVDYAGHRIRVVAKSEGARLYVDNELLDVTNDLYASEEEARCWACAAKTISSDSKCL
jgi:hypothetical protein